MTKTFSGTYWSMMAASVDYMGERLSYEVLLNKYLTQQHGQESNLHVSRVPNLGVCYLYSYLKKRHCQMAYVNFFTEEQQHLAALLQRNPKSVAITTTYYTRHSPIVEIVQFIKRHNPKTKIIVGGPHIYKLCSFLNEKRQDESFHDMGADIYINDSQGELTLSRVVHALTQTPPSDFRSIPNLIVSDGTSFHRTGREVEQNSLDNDAVDWRYFDRTFIAPIVPMRTARSCAYKCAFCDFPTLAGPLNLTSLDVVEQELRQLSEAGVTRILFVDDTFNVPLPRFKQLCRLMIDKKFDFEWFSYFRCSNADDEVFGLMRDSGCRGVLLGVESGDQTVLNHMNKKVKVDHYRKGIHQLKAHDIITYASFIIGFPGETRETALNTLRFIEETAPAFYTLNLYYYDKKTPIHQRAGDYDLRGQRV